MQFGFQITQFQFKYFLTSQLPTFKLLVRLMSQPMQKCDNCLKMLPQSKIATHFGYCRRNIKKCKQCGQMYDINFQQDHEEEFHSKQKCNYCNREFPKTDISNHKNSCSHKPKFCEYCQQSVPVADYDQHFKMCEARTKVCDKCRKDIKNKDFLVHLTTCRGFVQQPKPKQRQAQLARPKKAQQYYRRDQNDYKREENQRVKVNSQQAKDSAGSKKEIPIRKQPEIKSNVNKNYAPISYEHVSSNNNQRRDAYGRPIVPPPPNVQQQQPYKEVVSYNHQQFQQPYKEMVPKDYKSPNEVNKTGSYGVKRQRIQVQVPKPKISDNKQWEVNHGSKKIISESNPARKQQPKYAFEQINGKERVLNYLDDKPTKIETRQVQYNKQYGTDKNKNHIYSKPEGNQYQKEIREDKYKGAPIKPNNINQQVIRKTEQKRPQNIYSHNSNQNNRVNLPVSQKEIGHKNVQPFRQEKAYKKEEHSSFGQSIDYIEGEDTELQKAIMMSMGITNQNKYRQANKITKPSKSYKNELDLAKQFGDIDMNSSFYRDLQNQEAYEQQIKKNYRR